MQSFERRAGTNKHRYSRKLEYYCYERWRKACSRGNRECELFWLNMHYMYGLMRMPKKRREQECRTTTEAVMDL